MKLIKCHIENFGKLNNQNFVFNDGLTSFVFANGYGKSTLVAFIKAMLYGLRGVRANSKDFEERLKYYPFRGGSFGGSLTLLHEGREYTVERFFDEKSERADTLCVYSAGEKTDRLGEDIGRALTGLDAESFARVMLMNSTDAVYGGTSEISARLWGSESDGGESFDDAVSRLDASKKQLKAARGKGGEISRLDEYILSLNQSIENTERAAAELDFLYNKKSLLSSDIRALDEKKRTLDAESLLKEKMKTYAFHLNKINEKRAEAERLKELYPSGPLPEAREAEIKASLGELERTLGAKGARPLNVDKQTRLNALEEKFKDIKAAEQDLLRLGSVSELYTDKKAAAEEIKPTLRHSERFKGHEPQDAQINEQKQNAQNYEKLKSEADGLLHKGGISKGSLLFVAALLLIAAGTGFLFISKTAGILLLAIGLLALTAAFILKPKAKYEKALLEKAEMYEASLCEFLSKFGYSTEERGSARFAFKLFLTEYGEYCADASENKEIESKRNRLYAECSVLDAQAREILSLYLYKLTESDTISNMTEQMSRELALYKELLSERDEMNKREAVLDAEASALLQRLKALITDYAPINERGALAKTDSPTKIREITDTAVLDRAALARCERELRELISTAEEYRLKAGLPERAALDGDNFASPTPEHTLLDGSRLSKGVGNSEAISVSELPEKRKELARLEQKITTIEAEVDAAWEQKRALLSAEEKRTELLHRYQMLDLTISFLKDAERTLSEKYIAPLRKRFLSYASAAQESIGETFTMDKAFNIRFEQGGKSRDERHLSQGQHAIISLSLKLSLIDAMYEDEGFIILDDPFAPLDEDNFKSMQKLIKTISKNKQIVYFSCHNSRKI